MNEEIIKKLRRGINSPETPEWARERMQEQLDELLNPEPEPEPEPEPIIEKPKKKKAPKIELPHEKYLADNNIDKKTLPLEIRRKILGLGMFIGKDSEKVRAKAPEISNNIIEMIKAHLTPPPPPKREYTAEERKNLLVKYAKRRLQYKQLTEI